MSEEEKKMTPLNEKKQKGVGIEWFFAGEVKEAVQGLMSKDFIMSILAEDVRIDTEEEMKFIDVEGVRSKFKKHFGAGLTDEI